MVYKLNHTKKAEELFGNWQETLIWSCLQKVMGDIYADSLEKPQSVMAVLGDFSFFAGKPDEELIMYKPAECTQDFIIMVPGDDKWAKLICDKYGDRAKAVTRYAIKKEKDVFDTQKLRSAVNSISKEYSIRIINRELYEMCRSNDWSKDLVSQYKDYETYKRMGMGVAVLKDGLMVSGASSYSTYNGGIEIEIDTKEGYRRKGLAYACGAGLILECIKNGLYPSWDAQNKWSVSLAEKLGYHYDHQYTAFEIWGY